MSFDPRPTPAKGKKPLSNPSVLSNLCHGDGVPTSDQIAALRASGVPYKEVVLNEYHIQKLANNTIQVTHVSGADGMRTITADELKANRTKANRLSTSPGAHETSLDHIPIRESTPQSMSTLFGTDVSAVNPTPTEEQTSRFAADCVTDRRDVSK